MSPLPDWLSDRLNEQMATNEQTFTELATMDDVDVDVDALFDVLSSPRRRFVLAYLQKRHAPMALSTLADEIGAWELDAEIDEVPANGRKAIYVSLYHIHVPKMVEAGLVEYDDDRETVTTTSTAEKLTSLVHLPTV